MPDPNERDDPQTVELNQASGPQYAAPGSLRPGADLTRPAPQPWAESASRRLDVIARIACLAAGCALVVAAIVALFVGVGDTALIPVLAAGFLLVLMPAVVDRLRSMKAGRFEIQLIEQIAGNARKSAELLRRLGLEAELDAYATIYTELRGSELADVRGQLLDRIVQRVSTASVVEKFDRGEVREIFMNGSPIVRVLALGLMEGDLSLIDIQVLLEAVNRSLTGNEQFHALKLVLNGWGRLAPDERTELRAAIDSDPQISHGRGRSELAQRIRDLV